jgi:hypothetical protein
MGMYDSFIIQHEGVEREIQTKEFFNVMDRYRVGDIVSGAAPGVQVLHDCFYLDQDRNMTWEDEKKDREIHVFLMLRFSVFMHYYLVEEQLTQEAIEKKVFALQSEILTDSAKFELICIDSLKQKTERIVQLSVAVRRITRVVEATKISDTELKTKFFISEDEKRAQTGELVDVIEEIVSEFKNDETPWF